MVMYKNTDSQEHVNNVYNKSWNILVELVTASV